MNSWMRAVVSVAVLVLLAEVPSRAQSVPGVPGALAAQVAGNVVTLMWGAAFPTPTTYVVEAGSAPGLTDLGTVSVGPVTVLVVPSVPTGNYFVRVRAASGVGTSAPTADTIVTVGAACQLPPAPTGLTGAVTANTATLQWSGTGPFRLAAGRTPGASNVFAGDVGASTSLVADVPAGAYFVRVHARNSCGVSLASNEVVLHVHVPEAPANLSSSVIGNQLRLLWSPPSAGAAPLSYVLEAGSGPGAANLASMALPVSPTRFDVSPVPNGTYYVRVRSASGQGVGPASSDLAFTVGPALAGTTTVTFDALTGSTGTPFSSHLEQGVLVEPVTGSWSVLTYGRPGPAIHVARTAGGPAIVADVRVTAGGAPFRLSSVDLYSSVTPIPYTITGTLAGATVFTVTSTVPNTFGNYATVANPYSTASVDTVLITVTNPATPSCTTCGNPLGIDNIVVWR